MPTCPMGHQSTSSDYCDTCGAPIGAAQTDPAAGSNAVRGEPTPTAVGGTQPPAGSDLGGLPAPDGAPPDARPCPNCSAINSPDALFCEQCGYDFTTGALPRGADAPIGTAPASAPAPASSLDLDAPADGPHQPSMFELPEEPSPAAQAQAQAQAGKPRSDVGEGSPVVLPGPTQPSSGQPDATGDLPAAGPAPATDPAQKSPDATWDLPAAGPAPATDPGRRAAAMPSAAGSPAGVPGEGDGPFPDIAEGQLAPAEAPTPLSEPVPRSVVDGSQDAPERTAVHAADEGLADSREPAAGREPAHVPAPADVPASEDAPADAPASEDAPADAPASEDQPADAPASEDAPALADPPAPTGEPTAIGPAEWVAEVWIDPDWYEAQDSPDALPSPGLPRIVPLVKRQVQIGRPSRSRGIDPDIDCDPDNGASRRQAMLSTDGSRWFVEDVGSSNGTYVGEMGEPLPVEPIRGRTELTPDARIYVGSWTRIVVRRTTPDEATP